MPFDETQQVSVLIVDDTPDNLKLLSGMLQEEGFYVRTLPGGKLALQSIEVNKPDLLLLDINMPDMSGYEVCEALKKDSRFTDIPVIFISALSEAIDKVRAFQVGGVDYITKPFHIEEVKARINHQIKLKSLQNKLEYFNRNLQEKVRIQSKEIANAQISTIMAIVKLAEARDDDTGHHIERTRKFCRTIALNLRQNSIYTEIITERFIDTINIASPLHDVGKIAIPDRILLKPGRLTEEEMTIMKTHAELGAETLNNVLKEYPHNDFINMGISIARHHHERWDGTGYPDGLSGDSIPLAARIMTLSDVYDALRSKRVYKEAIPHEKSCEIINQESGKMFDPQIVQIFNRIEGEIKAIRDSMSD